MNKLLRPIEERGRIETAHRAKMFCSQIFSFSVATDQAERDPTQDLRGALRLWRLSTIPLFCLEPERIVHLLNSIKMYNGFVVYGFCRVRYALKMAPLLFVHPGGLRQAEWSEINGDEALWRVLAEK